MAGVILYKKPTTFLIVSTLYIATYSHCQLSYQNCCTVDPECITFQCERLWDSMSNLFSFQFTWTTPPYLRHGNIIHRFRVVFTMENEQAIQENVDFPLVRVDLHVSSVATTQFECNVVLKPRLHHALNFRQ